MDKTEKKFLNFNPNFFIFKNPKIVFSVGAKKYELWLIPIKKDHFYKKSVSTNSYYFLYQLNEKVRILIRVSDHYKFAFVGNRTRQFDIKKLDLCLHLFFHEAFNLHLEKYTKIIFKRFYSQLKKTQQIVHKDFKNLVTNHNFRNRWLLELSDSFNVYENESKDLKKIAIVNEPQEISSFHKLKKFVKTNPFWKDDSQLKAKNQEQ